MKSISLAAIPTELLNRIRSDAVGHFRLVSEPVASAAWQILNPYSKVLCIRLTSDEWSKRVFVKLPLKPIDPARLAHATKLENSSVRKEFEALRALAPIAAPATSGAGACTVTPLAYYADLLALVTIEAEGRTLRAEYSRQTRLVSLPGARQSVVDRVALCGDWLRLFHASTSQGFGGFDLDELLAYNKTRLARLRKHAPAVISVDDEVGIVRAATKLAQSIPGRSLRISGRHNDFASHNIIACSGGGIRVLDFTMFDNGGNGFDVCNFWFELEMLKCDPSYSWQLLSRLQAVFLERYGGMDPDAPEFVLARLRYSINRLLNSVTDERPSRHISPHWRLTVRRIRSWLRLFAAKGN